jgi:hypothetical protein
MTTRAATVTINADKTGLAVWLGLDQNDDGEGVAIGRYADKTIQVVGAFGSGGDVDMEGSNDGGTTWGQLHDLRGTVISIGDSLPVVPEESPLLIRPNVSAGDGDTDLDVYIAFTVKGA